MIRDTKRGRCHHGIDPLFVQHVISSYRSARGDVVDRSGTDPTPPWLGRLTLGGRIACRQVQRRRQTIGIDAIALGGRFDHRSRLPPWPTATARRQGGVGVENRFGPLFEILPGGDRVGAMLTGDFGLRLNGGLRLIKRVVPLRVGLRAIGGTSAAIVAAIGATGTVAAITARLVATAFARAILTIGALLTIGTLGAILSLGTILSLGLAFGPFRPLETILTLATILPLGIALLAAPDRLALVTIFVVAVEILRGAALLRLILEPAALIAQHPEIMIGELEVVFGVHPVALTLRIRREVLVLLV